MKDSEKVGKTAKGIKRNVIKENIKHEDFKESHYLMQIKCIVRLRRCKAIIITCKL